MHDLTLRHRKCATIHYSETLDNSYTPGYYFQIFFHDVVAIYSLHANERRQHNIAVVDASYYQYLPPLDPSQKRQILEVLSPPYANTFVLYAFPRNTTSVAVAPMGH